MTSEIWCGGGDEARRNTVGAAVRRGVAGWGGGHVEAFVNVRGRPLVESAMAYPLNGAPEPAAGRLQAELDRAGL